MEKKSGKTWFGIAGFAIALIGLLFIFWSPILSLILGIIGLILCIVQFKQKKTGIAIAGLIISIIAIIIGLLYIISALIVFNTVQNSIDSAKNQLALMEKNLSH
jgi:hypothetical protein